MSDRIIGDALDAAEQALRGYAKITDALKAKISELERTVELYEAINLSQKDRYDCH